MIDFILNINNWLCHYIISIFLSVVVIYIIDMDMLPISHIFYDLFKVKYSSAQVKSIPQETNEEKEIRILKENNISLKENNISIKEENKQLIAKLSNNEYR